MALETVVFPNELLFNNCTTTATKDIYSTMSSSWAHDCLFWDSSSSPPTAPPDSNWDIPNIPSSSPPPPPPQAAATASATAAVGRRKRRRAKSSKNKEEVENQRMTHIAVERNRRRQMNDYLSVLRSLMPPSYVQRGDQASIIGGAINFVKELEQLLQSLEAQKRIKNNNPTSSAATTSTTTTSDDSDSCGFAGFFTFPQYTTYSGGGGAAAEKTTSTSSAAADIEVTMVESHANVKVLSRRRPKQLLKMFVGLQNLRLTTLHLNVTTVDPMVLYSFSVKVEDDCQLTTVDEIATAVYQVLGEIQQESGFTD
ncbi:Transcription factor bHLH96 [Acorus calamus]|uniref:Transcription factor bHLH96 n=1 Tax=Acorus calamus TaxID=4465 RepID=A0AAV9CHW1_ACOCL|nr:Transcription factor bHLH96 [Acorus calamus]